MWAGSGAGSGAGAERVRQPGGARVRPADRLAVGVSGLTRPDSFHAGSCDGEKGGDRARLGLFDAGVASLFEASACLLCEAPSG